MHTYVHIIDFLLSTSSDRGTVITYFPCIVTPWPVISSVSVTYPPLGRCYSSLSVSWDGPTAACLTYTIWYSTNSGTVTQPPPEALTMSEISSTSAVLAGLTQGTVYYIWVAAVSPGGQSHYSSRVTKRVENGLFLKL